MVLNFVDSIISWPENLFHPFFIYLCLRIYFFYMLKKARLPLFFFHLIFVCLLCTFAVGHSFPFSQVPEETFAASRSFVEDVTAVPLNEDIQISWDPTQKTS